MADELNLRASRTTEHRYCGPCCEYYDDGDVLEQADVLEDITGWGGTPTGRECPTCGEEGKTVDELGEQQDEDRLASYHDGGSQFWADIERNRG